MSGFVRIFMNGSGTTCVVAKQLNRKYMGVELNQEYFDLAKKSIEG